MLEYSLSTTVKQARLNSRSSPLVFQPVQSWYWDLKVGGVHSFQQKKKGFGINLGFFFWIFFCFFSVWGLLYYYYYYYFLKEVWRWEESSGYGSKNPLDRPAVIRTSGTRGLRKGTWSRGFQGSNWKITFSWYDIICLHESVAWPEVTWKGGEIYSS